MLKYYVRIIGFLFMIVALLAFVSLVLNWLLDPSDQFLPAWVSLVVLLGCGVTAVFCEAMAQLLEVAHKTLVHLRWVERNNKVYFPTDSQ